MEADSELKDLISKNVEHCMHEDAYYEKMATPLKSAAFFKEEERAKLQQQFECQAAHDNITAASVLILSEMPKSQLFSKEDCEKITAEFENAIPYFEEKGSKLQPEEGEEIVGWQKLFGFSDESLFHIYTYASDLASKAQYPEAICILTFLEMMVPQASSFWIGHAMCLQAMDLHNEALILLDFVKQIDPQNPLASYHMIQTLKALKEDEKAKEETETLKTMISQMNAEDKTTWEEMINNI